MSNTGTGYLNRENLVTGGKWVGGALLLFGAAYGLKKLGETDTGRRWYITLSCTPVTLALHGPAAGRWYVNVITASQPTDQAARRGRDVIYTAVTNPPVPGRTVYFRLERTASADDVPDPCIGDLNHNAPDELFTAVTDTHGEAQVTLRLGRYGGDRYRVTAGLTAECSEQSGWLRVWRRVYYSVEDAHGLVRDAVDPSRECRITGLINKPGLMNWHQGNPYVEVTLPSAVAPEVEVVDRNEMGATRHGDVLRIPIPPLPPGRRKMHVYKWMNTTRLHVSLNAQHVEPFFEPAYVELVRVGGPAAFAHHAITVEQLQSGFGADKWTLLACPAAVPRRQVYIRIVLVDSITDGDDEGGTEDGPVLGINLRGASIGQLSFVTRNSSHTMFHEMGHAMKMVPSTSPTFVNNSGYHCTSSHCLMYYTGDGGAQPLCPACLHELRMMDLTALKTY